MPLLISAVDRKRSRDEFELCQRELVRVSKSGSERKSDLPNPVERP